MYSIICINHSLVDHRPHLFNSVTGQIAPDLVNVAESIVIGEQMESKYRASRPEGFFNTISSPIKTKSALQRNVKGNKAKSVINLQNISLRLMMIGQRRKMALEPLFG